MADWRFSIGNIVNRAANAVAAVAPAASDAVLPLSQWGSGYPDQQGAFQWRADGTYAADVDGNMLASSSERADAPTGWYDLQNYLAGTPGLPANPPDWGTYDGRTALRLFRPVAQDVEVMPGEDARITGSIRLPAASLATGIEVRVVDMTTGHQYDAGGAAWDDDGKIEEQAVDDVWKDFAVTITADPSHGERRTYRVVVSPQAAAFDATTFCYISATGGSGSPALFPELDTFALVDHNLPAGAVVTLVPQPAGTTLTLMVGQPSCYVVAPGGSQLVQVWRVSIAIPAALRPSAPRPIAGEPWLGLARTMLVGSPVPTFGGEESTPGQISVDGPRKRREVVPDEARAVGEMPLPFRARDDASFEQMRDEVMRLTRYGADPVLLLPDVLFEGGRLYHGRIADRLSWSIITPTATGAARSFAMPFVESPAPSP